MYHKMSPSKVLAAAYPEHSWKPWIFDRAPKNLGSDPKLAREYCEWFAKQRNFQSLEDWYNVKNSELSDNNGTVQEL